SPLLARSAKMHPRHLAMPLILFVLILCGAAAPCRGQIPSPTPTPPVVESQDKVKVFTEEVVIPVSAYDDSGHLSAAFEPQDIIVFEDDVRQIVRSVRRIPANVLLLLDTGGDLNPAMSVSTPKDIATRLTSN